MSAPARIGRFEIKRELGRGAMGLVYLAHDPKIDRQVAIKTIHRNEGLPEAEAEEQQQRFLREAQAAGKLIHPGIVTIFDVGEDAGVSYIAMEYIEGETLEAATKPGALLPVDKIVRYIIQACEALDYAHQFKIIHRDVKPANLMVVGDRQLKITDFGLAKNPSANLTSAGTLIGTPNYMSPEQIMGKPLDGRSDLFSLGVVLYELLTGERPFGGDTISTIIYKVLHELPKQPDLANPRVPPPLSRVIVRAIDKDPDKRYQSGEDFSTALMEYAGAVSTDSRAASLPDGVAPTSIIGEKEVLAASGARPRPGVHRPTEPLGRRGRPREAAPAKRRSLALPIILVLLLAGAGAGGWYFRDRIEPILREKLGLADTSPGGADDAAGTRAESPGPTGPAVDLPEPSPEGATVSIDVSTDPPGGRLYLDDREVLGGVVLLPEDSKESHTLVAENDCFVDSTVVSAGDAGPVVVELKTPKLSEVRVTSEPPGSRILLNGRVQDAVTPANLNVEACRPHEIAITRSGYKKQTRKFDEATVWATVSPVHMDLEKLPDGFISVKAPYEVQVYADGKLLGAAGSRLKIPAGRYTVRIVSKKLFVDLSTDLEVPPDGTATPKVSFPGLGELTVYANPSDGEVFVNGVSLGVPPIQAYSMAEGTYQVRYVLDSGSSEERTVLVLADQPRTEKFIIK